MFKIFRSLFIVASACLTMSSTAVDAQQITVKCNDWVWQQINIGDAYRTFIPKKKIKVAIIDDAMDIDHPLLQPFISYNTGEIAENNIDDDKNGFVDDVNGWDFADNDNDVRPPVKDYIQNLHGTRIADIFLQALDQLMPDVQTYISILPLKDKADAAQNNYATKGYEAIEYAIAQHVDVMVCSWAGTMISEDQKKILKKAADAGIVIVASAGNYYFNEGQYPGAYDPVICVSAVDKNRERQKVADYGPYVDISAPGDSILTILNKTAVRGDYMSGTSPATPIVAAVITAMKACGYTGDIMSIDRLLKNSATPLDAYNPFFAGKMGAGELNVATLRKLMQKDTAYNYQQAKGYVNLNKLSTTQPIKIAAAGVFKDYKLLVKPAVKYAGSAVRVKEFKNGQVKEKIIDKEGMNRPLFANADSIYLYSAGAGKKTVTTKGTDYWYYEAETIDSSNYFCTGITEINDTAGYIEDGSGPADYTGRNDCKWLIKVPEGKFVQIEFESFDTEPMNDQVYIFNGDKTNAQILAIFSGHEIPPRIKAGGNLALVWFITNDKVHGKGWKLHYKAVDTF